MAFIAEKFNSVVDNQNQWRHVLGIKENNVRCFPYHGLGHALTDLLFGLKYFWPTKKNILITPWGSPLVQKSVQAFVKDGHSLIRKIAPAVFPQEVSKDLLAAVLVRDHCFTGEVLTVDEDLKALNDKRIPHIEIQHAWAWSHSKSPLPFGAQIKIIDNQKAIVVMGARFRLMSHSAHLMDWSGIGWARNIESAKAETEQNRSLIENLEEKLQSMSPPTPSTPATPSSIELYPLNRSSRLYDRILLVLSEVHGLYFLEQYLAELQEPPLALPGFESRCETTNLTRWEGIFPWDWWGEKSLTEAQQLSLVALSVPLLKKPKAFESIYKVYKECWSASR